MEASKHSVCVAKPEQSTCLFAEVPLSTVYSMWHFPTKEYLVKSERRKQYPKNWEQLARQCKERAGNRCEFCPITQGKKRKSRRTGKRYTVYLHAAHANHDIGNPTPILLCLCPTCHGRYDYRYRRREQQIALERLKHHALLIAR